jgi:hypothetical protein
MGSGRVDGNTSQAAGSVGCSPPLAGCRMPQERLHCPDDPMGFLERLFGVGDPRG